EPRIKLTKKANKANKLPRARAGPPYKKQGGQIEIATTIAPNPILKLTEKANKANKLPRARSGPLSKKPRGPDRDRYNHYAQTDIKAH
ncbi:hypothetical protein LDJ79_00295, partial [Vibrio tritonius]